jgi:hypothetical protein
MQSAYPTLKVARVTVTAQVSYQYPETEDDESTLAMLIFGPDDSNLINYDNDVQVLSGVKGSNAVQKVYAVMSDYTEAEQPPTGLAAVLYSALSTLQYEGSWNVIRQEPAASNTMGIVLNLTGGRTEWASMNALVQEIVDDLDNGITTYKFGPAGHLTIQDLMEQLRTTRGRTMSSKIKERQTGQPDADVVNGSGHTAETNNSTPPMPFPGYPFLDFIDEQDDDEGNGVTWDVLFGYGQSTFSGADEIDHSGPIEKLEISVGNDGSDWTGPEYDSSDLNNALSIISGDEDYTTDCIRIGATDGDEGGSIRLLPGDPSIYLSTNLDPADDGDGDAFIHIDLGNQIIANQDEDGSYIHLDLSGDPIININNANTGNYSSLDENSLTLYDETYIGCTTTIQAYDAEIDASPAGGATVALDALNQVISITDPSGDPQTAMGPGSLKFWNPGVGGNDISVQLIDPSIYLYGPEFNQIILQCNQVGPYISLAGDLGYTAYSVWMDLNYTGPGPATWQTRSFSSPMGPALPSQ